MDFAYSNAASLGTVRSCQASGRTCVKHHLGSPFHKGFTGALGAMAEVHIYELLRMLCAGVPVHAGMSQAPLRLGGIEKLITDADPRAR